MKFVKEITRTPEKNQRYFEFVDRQIRIDTLTRWANIMNFFRTKYIIIFLIK